MRNINSGGIVAGLAGLFLAAQTIVATELASAAGWQGGGGGWRQGQHAGGRYGYGAPHGAFGAWRQGQHFGGRYGYGVPNHAPGAWRRDASRWPQGGFGGGDAFRAVGRITAMSGFDHDHAGRYWHPGHSHGRVWYGGWWGPASTIAVVDVSPSDSGTDATCSQIEPVYSAEGDYIGREFVNVCR